MAVPESISKRIFLIGLMGSGKSYWGRQLAAHFKVPFLDLDKGIELAERCSISELFSAKGEEHFRAVERDTLQTLIHHPHFVMSCGGGTPCFFNNMHNMKNAGKVVWLNPPLETLALRLLPGRHKRPLIRTAKTEAGIIKILADMLQIRSPYYEMADHVITEISPTYQTFEKLLLHA